MKLEANHCKSLCISVLNNIETHSVGHYSFLFVFNLLGSESDATNRGKGVGERDKRLRVGVKKC